MALDQLQRTGAPPDQQVGPTRQEGTPGVVGPVPHGDALHQIGEDVDTRGRVQRAPTLLEHRHRTLERPGLLKVVNGALGCLGSCRFVEPGLGDAEVCRRDHPWIDGCHPPYERLTEERNQGHLVAVDDDECGLVGKRSQSTGRPGTSPDSFGHARWDGAAQRHDRQQLEVVGTEMRKDL